MTNFLRLCLILLLGSFSGLSSGAENFSVCIGDSLLLFHNVQFTKGNSVNVYLNGNNQSLIGTWSSILNVSALPDYKEKVFTDIYGNIWIRNIEILNEGKYILSYEPDIRNGKYEVQVNVMVAPASACKPMIEKKENYLNASLRDENCGRPLAHVKWMGYPDNSSIDNNVLRLPPENYAGTYYACAESQALKCVIILKLSDYCTNFRVQEHISSPVESETAAVRKVEIVMVTLLAVIVIAVLVARSRFLIRRIIKLHSDQLRRTHAASEENERLVEEAEHNTEEATTDYYASTNLEPPNITLCKTCNRKKMDMLIMPCSHKGTSYLPTCKSCINLVRECQKCNTKEEYGLWNVL